MREIKFRAWTDKKEMINPVLWIGEYNHFYGEDFTNNQYGNIIDIMQFTGLKDKNGVEIYEGDIIKEGKVYFDESLLGFFIEGIDEYDRFPLYDIKRPEVIGNIHENPELIK